MDAVTLLKRQIDLAHLMLEGTMADVTPEQAHWQPGGGAAPIGANYAHIVWVEDRYVSTLLGDETLAETSFAGRMGLSETIPAGPGWDAWARRVTIDLPALKAYAQAVYERTGTYVGSLAPDDLAREVDQTHLGGGRQTLDFVLSVTIAAHANMHHGEISCLKGLQGARGYPI